MAKLQHSSSIGSRASSYPTKRDHNRHSSKDQDRPFWSNIENCPKFRVPLQNSKISLFLIFLLFLAGSISIFSIFNRLGENSTTQTRATKNGNLFSIWNCDGKIAYEDIVEATADFDIKYCIGTGGYGSVYKAQLPCRNMVTLKKLHRLEAKESTFDRNFRNENLPTPWL